ncbi:transmembrane protein, putative (macronuclear) [Tetrahymena thermophila SB210]|uniref:Transmembrane protein, putative n=1 Tax=Tetrahymena thermophila (strain SB210) TaxID=312017 RepID=I7LXR1_TETTS|nr:transmembrane protein, putative [Tetrahymena thermophila SB210]EAS05966.3 transmembrane protein, putative [Tetrahymena thermophila SB210]|eukprot:XP_001026211.3 transmembrane protein, putative [Tetrahymena thermophila SB210]
MRNSTIFTIIALFCSLSLFCAKEQAMPFAFHSKNMPFSFEDLYSTKEQILDKFSASIATQKLESGVKAIVINIQTPSSLAGTIDKIKEYAKYLPQFTNLIQNYFRNQIVYDSISFVQEIQNSLEKLNIQVTINSEVKPNQVAIEQIDVKLEDLAQLEQIVKKSIDQEDASVFIIFTQNSSSKVTRVLQQADDNNGPSMVQIPNQTLFGLILVFILFIPVLWIGISCLYGIESPEKFATQNLVVGREY